MATMTEEALHAQRMLLNKLRIYAKKVQGNFDGVESNLILQTMSDILKWIENNTSTASEDEYIGKHVELQNAIQPLLHQKELMEGMNCSDPKLYTKTKHQFEDYSIHTLFAEACKDVEVLPRKKRNLLQRWFIEKVQSEQEDEMDIKRKKLRTISPTLKLSTSSNASTPVKYSPVPKSSLRKPFEKGVMQIVLARQWWVHCG